MTPFQKGTLEGFGWVVGCVGVVAVGIALCAIAIAVMVLAWKLMWAVLFGGCL